MPYRQLSSNERYLIDSLRLADWSLAAIARQLGRATSTVAREIRRNRTVEPVPNGLGGMKGYIGGVAQERARARRAAANQQRRKIKDNPLGDYVRQKLTCYWSPQQIAGRLVLDHPEDATMRISHEAVYQWVYRRSRQGETWFEQLRRARKRRRPRIPVRNREKPRFAHATGIEHRPAIVAERVRLGDWESDTVVGSRRSRAVLATHVERVSRYVLIRKLPNGRAQTFNRATFRAFAQVPAECCRTLTVDNGSEFARFVGLERRLGASVYFAQPYKAWQRGANENTNGLIRQFFPKGMDLRQVSHQQVAKVEHLLNNRPRKCLNYRTPAEVFLPPPAVALRN